MGGWGSGTWTRSNTKATVESCPAVLSVYDLARDGVLQTGARGTLWWTSPLTDCTLMMLEYAVHQDEFGHTFRVRYRYGSEKIAFEIRLQTTKCNYGGKRWWFTCPLKGCDRRVAKLYLSGPYFGCRHCHDLTYRTCQRSKRSKEFEKEFMARHLGTDSTDPQRIF